MSGTARLAELFGRRRFTIKPGLERILSLLERHGHPEQRFTAVHVVGTNGKGSTAAMLATMLTQAGYTTGLFTSPHLISYAERFQVNGTLISAAELERLTSLLLDTATPEETFFELTTALACLWFAASQVQIGVLEAGMGGRSDATAAVPSPLTVITPIGLDHCQWLGTSTTAIAVEKVAIAAPGSCVVSARQEPDVQQVISTYCLNHQCRLVLQDQDFTLTTDTNGSLHYCSTDSSLQQVRLNLNGQYQIDNAAVALAAAEQLTAIGFPVPPAALLNGLATTRWPGRMELIRLDDGINLLLDGAHNPAGAEALSRSLAAMADSAAPRKLLLLGMMADKVPTSILQPLVHQFKRVITVTPNQDRSLPAAQLAAACRTAGFPCVEEADTTAEGLQKARAVMQPGDLLVAAGSLFLVAELKALLSGVPCEAVRG